MNNIPIDRSKRFKSFFSDVVEAIAGTEQDFTEGRLSRAILLLSIPAVLEMVMESVFVIVDIYFVSKLGANAVATVGITESMVTIIYAIAIGLGTATTSMVSRRIGEKNPDAASIAAFQAILTGLIVSIIIGIPGALFSKNLLGMMGASKPIIDSMSGYTSIMLGGNMVIMMLFIINAIFRSAGDAAVAMKVLWIGNIINIIIGSMSDLWPWTFSSYGSDRCRCCDNYWQRNCSSGSVLSSLFLERNVSGFQ